MSRAGDLMIVRHGPERGRRLANVDCAFERLAADEPVLSAAIRVHRTGSSAPPSLEGIRAVFFWLADPLRELYPECHREAAAIADEAKRRGLRLANPPDALSNTMKSVQARRWRDAGIDTPAYVPFVGRRGFEAALADAAYPALLESDAAHGQRHMRICRSEAEGRAIPDQKIPYPGALAPFFDVRSEWRKVQPDALWARFHHKKRVHVMGNIVLPWHVLFSESPIVGVESSTLRSYRRRSRAAAWLALRRRPLERECLEAEVAFAACEPECADLMRRAARALDLDFAAIDYATLPDGRPLLWEANPYDPLPGPTRSCLAQQRGLRSRRDSFYRALARFFRGLIA